MSTTAFDFASAVRSKTPREPIVLVAIVAVAGVAAVLGAGSVIAPALVVLAMLGLVFVAISFWNLAVGVVMFTILIFFTRLPAVGDLSIAKAAGAVLAIAWVAALIGRREELPLLTRDRPALAYAGLLLVLWAGASLLWARDLARAQESAFQFAQGLLLFLIVFSATRNGRHARWILYAFIFGATLAAAVGLAGFTKATEDEQYRQTQRLTGGIGDPNDLAAMLVPALVFALFAIFATRVSLLRWTLAASAAVCAVSLLLTESRGGLLALAVAFAAAIVLGGRLRPRVVAAVLVTAALGVVYYAQFAPPEAVARVTGFRESGGSGRTDLWSVGTEIARDHPLVGVGAGNFQVLEPFYAVGDVSVQRVEYVVDRPLAAHNTYLQVLTELGIVGLVLFSALIATALVVAVRAIPAFVRAGDWQTEIAARGLVVGTIGMLSAFFFISAHHEKQLFLLLGLLTGLGSIAAKSAREVSREERQAPELPADDSWSRDGRSRTGTRQNFADR